MAKLSFTATIVCLVCFLLGCEKEEGRTETNLAGAAPSQFQSQWYSDQTPAKNESQTPPEAQPANPQVSASPQPASPQTSATLADLSSNPNPIASLTLTSADQINQAEAEKILAGIGMTGLGSVHKLSFAKAMEGLCKSATYQGRPCAGASLNSTVPIAGGGGQANMKSVLFENYRLMKDALGRYADKPNISKRDTPEQFDNWVKEASNELTRVPADKREKLMRSLMKTETDQAHWKNFIPVTSHVGAVGYGQFLYRTAVADVKINPFDPKENIAGIGKYLNGLIQSRGGLRQALMYYNAGGTGGGGAYADGILARI